MKNESSVTVTVNKQCISIGIGIRTRKRRFSQIVLLLSNDIMIELVPSRVGRAFGSETAYSDALSSVNKYNSRLLRERRTRLRLPFVDSQTHIIQMPTQHYLWRHPTHRLLPSRNDQVVIYARKPWHKRRPQPPASSSVQSTQVMTNTNGVVEPSTNGTSTKVTTPNGTNVPPQTSMEDDPRVLMRAGDLGMAVCRSTSLIHEELSFSL